MSVFSLAIKNWLDTNYFQYKDKFLVMEETKMYKHKEDESIYLQWKGKMPQVAEVYLRINPERTEYICDINEHMPQDVAYFSVVKGLNKIKKELEKEYASTT